MACILVVLLCLVGLMLMCAGAAEIERRADRWVRYERWMHPPDDNGDGVTLLEEDDNENGR